MEAFSSCRAAGAPFARARTASARRVARAVCASVATAAFAASAATAEPDTDTRVGRAGPSFASAGSSPTSLTSESKLWWNDGSWWASMWAEGAGFRIFRFDRGRSRWIDTGTPIDDRRQTFADTLWDGRRLYVASHKRGRPGPRRASLLYRYDYDRRARRYRLDRGFPVTITRSAPSSLVIARDSGRTLWASWVDDRRVYVNHPVGDHRRWATPFPLPVANTRVDDEDVAAIVAFSRRIGVLWSNQRAGAFFFAVHRDGAPRGRWRAPIRLRTGAGGADNHVNLKTDGAGRLFAVVKTSATARDDPLIVLVARARDGTWTSYLVGNAAENQTRPVVMVDKARAMVHVFATGPAPTPAPAETTAIYRETAGLEHPVFPTGPGTVVLHDPEAAALRDVTASKRPITAGAGFPLLASNEVTHRYWYRHLPRSALRAAPAPFPSAPTSEVAPPPPPTAPGPSGPRWDLYAGMAAVLLVVVVVVLVAVRRLSVRR